MIVTTAVSARATYHPKFNDPNADIILQSKPQTIHPDPQDVTHAKGTKGGQPKYMSVTSYVLEGVTESDDRATQTRNRLNTWATTLYRFRKEELRKKSPVYADALEGQPGLQENTIDGLPVLQLHHTSDLLNIAFAFFSNDIDDFPVLRTMKLEKICGLWDLSLYLESPLIQSHCELAIS